MRYSLKTLAITFVVIGLAVALVMSSLRVRQLTADKKALQDLLGVFDDNRPGDRYDIRDYSNFHANPNCYGFQLLRVQNYEKYQLDVVYYDGETQATSTMQAALTDPLVAIICNPTQPEHYFAVYPTTHLRSISYQKLPFPGTYLFHTLHASSNLISDESIGSYFFQDKAKAVEREGPHGGEMSPHTPAEIRQLCDKYRLQAIYLQIVPK